MLIPRTFTNSLRVNVIVNYYTHAQMNISCPVYQFVVSIYFLRSLSFLF